MDLYDLLGASQEPLLEIHSWIQEANEASVGLPHAMNLASVDSNGQPSSRMVLLKSLSDKGLVFFTDYEGKKGQEIINNKKFDKTLNYKNLKKSIDECSILIPLMFTEGIADGKLFSSMFKTMNVGMYEYLSKNSLIHPIFLNYLK